jgi:hypothetical protein
MPDLQPPVPPATTVPASPAAVDALSGDDADFALGCECADPVLQIERWMQVARAGA